MSRGRLLLALLLVGCIDDEAEREAEMFAAASVVRTAEDGTIHLSEADRRALALEVAEVVAGDLPDARLRFGLVRARLRDEAVLVSPIAGRIQHLAAAVVGQPVAIGQPIFSIVPILGTAENVAIKVQGADMQGQITALRGELTFREAEAVRARELAGPKIISAAKLQEAETAVQTARARLAALQQARGKNARGQSGDAEITVPVAGSIASIDVQVGAVVRAGDVLGRVLRAGPRWVEVAVDPGEAPADAYQVEAGGRWVEARRIATGAIVGADGMRRDRLEVTEAAELLYPGAVVSVRVIRGDTAGLILPASAVVASPSGRLVYVEVEPGVFAQRKVQLLAQVGDQARVAGPLASGDRVVSHGVMGLHGETLRSELRHTE